MEEGRRTNNCLLFLKGKMLYHNKGYIKVPKFYNQVHVNDICLLSMRKFPYEAGKTLNIVLDVGSPIV